MLKREDNERLVRVGRGTPGGELMRRYWIPALLSSELPEPDGAPVRVRLLAEDLIAFRDTNGAVGLVEAYCPHRRAPLFFGRNEECGLRCVYHGWKFDVTGKCVDMPNEPADTPMKARMRITAYPTVELGGVVWAYLGQREAMPEIPDYEWLRAPPSHRFVSKTFESCNYLQALEGGLDTSHSSFVHNNKLGDRNEVRNRDRAPRIEVEPTDYGYRYTSTRNAGEQGSYVRVYHYLMPFQQMRGGVTAIDGRREEVPKLDGHLWVPIDDEHTWAYNWLCSFDDAVPLTPEFVEKWESFTGRSRDDLIPNSFALKRNLSNDYLIDRQVQKTRTFTGIKGLNTQDFALQEGMGPIVDRTRENLGSSDRAIVVMRRLLLEATQAVERGEAPRGVNPQSHCAVRPYDGFVPPGKTWQECFAGELVARW
jgi:phthalate 4,5-dioxygenase